MCKTGGTSYAFIYNASQVWQIKFATRDQAINKDQAKVSDEKASTLDVYGGYSLSRMGTGPNAMYSSTVQICSSSLICSE